MLRAKPKYVADLGDIVACRGERWRVFGRAVDGSRYGLKRHTGSGEADIALDVLSGDNGECIGAEPHEIGQPITEADAALDGLAGVPYCYRCSPPERCVAEPDDHPIASVMVFWRCPKCDRYQAHDR